MVQFRTTSIKAGCDINGDQTLLITVPPDIELGSFVGDFEVEIKRHRNKRSLNANALCWKCINSLAEILQTSNEEVYLEMLERYGVHKYIVVRPASVESVKGLFRAVHEMGGVMVGKNRGVQLRCVVGSSQYDTAQMSRLLDGIISECKEIGGFIPDEKDVGVSLNLWEKER